jgi:hypothetical protein
MLLAQISPSLFLSSKGCEHVHFDITICQIMFLYVQHNLRRICFRSLFSIL